MGGPKGCVGLVLPKSVKTHPKALAREVFEDDVRKFYSHH